MYKNSKTNDFYYIYHKWGGIRGRDYIPRPRLATTINQGILVMLRVGHCRAGQRWGKLSSRSLILYLCDIKAPWILEPRSCVTNSMLLRFMSINPHHPSFIYIHNDVT